MNDKLPILNYDAYEVSIDYYANVIYKVIAKSRSSALYKAYQKGEYQDSIPYSDFLKDKTIERHIHKLHPALLEDMFDDDSSLDYNRKYRDMKFLKFGMKVELHDNSIGYIIGSSGNLKAFLPETHETCFFHPTWRTTYFDECNNVIACY